MQEVSIGLIAAPELPEKIANDIVNELPRIFSSQIDDINWKIEIEINPLTGAAETQQEISDEAHNIMVRKNWDYTLCLTDLPLFSQKQIVLADVNYQLKIARISLPAFGFTPVRYRVKKAMIEIIGDLYYQGLKKEQYNVEKEGKSDVDKKTGDHVKKYFRFSPIRRIISPDGMNESNVRYIVIPKINGRLRLLLGMTHANRPWTIVSSFKPIIAVAFATGAYVLIFPTLWKLSVSFSVYRLIGLMSVAVVSMVIWMVVSHHLWEKQSEKSKKKLRRLYNYATITTLTIAVCSYYVMLFIIFLVAIMFFVPPDLFSSTTNIEGTVDLTTFVKLAWLATSVATIAGSIGASVENEELVRNVAYGYRQNRRYREMKQTESRK
ncbi:hypothetical protein GCM10011351_14160 [Paraliobacillus quinghaiensis]|uniref:5,10-methylene-tetrahydrofolate dehydrogenase n=1 Tax=Paraliobacillus quinghaiensis TaxID=470815 RepID=A0A917TNC0_9BACI|nr:hypothetical protein [Paraliobacillus quinghaiensis]GGM29259.1 hypothetical protein GCM10011351_14160 [Paraliobacillus quinghaiensis]